MLLLASLVVSLVGGIGTLGEGETVGDTLVFGDTLLLIVPPSSSSLRLIRNAGCSPVAVASASGVAVTTTDCQKK